MDELVIEYSNIPDSNILNGHVYCAYLDAGKNGTKAAEKLNFKSQDVNNLVRKIVKIKGKNLSRHREVIIAVLKQPFSVKRRTPMSTSSPTSDCSSAVFLPQTPTSPSPVLDLSAQTPTPPHPVLVVPPLPHPSTSISESTDICQRCARRTTIHSLQVEALATDLKKRKAEIVNLKSEIEAMRRTYKVSVVNQKYKRLEDRISKLKLEKRDLILNKGETERKIKRQKTNAKYYYKRRKREAEQKTENSICQSEEKAEEDAVEIQSLKNVLDESV